MDMFLKKRIVIQTALHKKGGESGEERGREWERKGERVEKKGEECGEERGREWERKGGESGEERGGVWGRKGERVWEIYSGERVATHS